MSDGPAVGSMPAPPAPPAGRLQALWVQCSMPQGKSETSGTLDYIPEISATQSGEMVISVTTGEDSMGVASFPMGDESMAMGRGCMRDTESSDLETGAGRPVHRGRSLTSDSSIMGGVQRRIRVSEGVTEVVREETEGGPAKATASLPETLWPPRSMHSKTTVRPKSVCGTENEDRANTLTGVTISLRMLIASLVVVQSLSLTGGFVCLLESLVAAELDEKLLRTVRLAYAAIFAGVTLLGAVISLCVGTAASRQFDRINTHVKGVQSTNMAVHQSDDEIEEEELPLAWISNAQRLQVRVSQLSSNLQVLPRFLPASVVQAILRGDETALRLHVTSREVSIMFSDVADFTRITEALHPNDMIFLLTRYLSVMSHIVEKFGGVVAEILGDGLLVFWNADRDVEDHAVKAVASALAQQKALVPLNQEMRRARLPTLATRIGISTGYVYTGNIGSEHKMKWGCMGDSVNLASRLEGLNKVYGTTVMCEHSTREAIRTQNDNFFVRRLDRVQVKGKTVPTEIYEVLGLVDEEDFDVVYRSTNTTSLSRVISVVMEDSRSAMLKSKALTFMKLPALRFRTSEGSVQGQGDLIQGGKSEASIASPSSAMAAATSSTRQGKVVRISDIVNNCLSDTVTDQAQQRVASYEEALDAFQAGQFVECKAACQALLETDDSDLATQVLLRRASSYIGTDGSTIVGLTLEERAAWTGVHIMDSK